MDSRDRTPKELTPFEDENVQGAERPERDDQRPDDDEPLLDIAPGDEDGLPDGPAKFRVPS